jgi:hypothetical protein
MRGALINALFACSAFAAAGCGIFEPVWFKVAPPLEPVWTKVSTEQLRAICDPRQATAYHAFSCVRRNLELGTCHVFSTAPKSEAPAHIIDHEEEGHCRKGQNHE